MATQTIYFTPVPYSTGATLYVFPVSKSLAQWTTYRVLMTEGTGADLGTYSCSYDDTNGSTVSVYSGATQPSSQAVAISDPISVSSSATANVTVYPVSSAVGDRVNDNTLQFYKDESTSVSIVTSATLTGKTLQFVVESQTGVDVLVIPSASISVSSQTATVTITTAVTSKVGTYNWSLRDITSGNSVLAKGELVVDEAPSADA